jgi:hypothetical protein
MNELQRQHYLSAFGVETYMPRWHLPFAPVSIACELPSVILNTPLQESSVVKVESNSVQSQPVHIIKSVGAELSPVNQLIGDLLQDKKSGKPVVTLATTAVSNNAMPINAADILAQLDAKPITIESLSVWRPLEGVMIIDSRNTRLALPTELLLNNILRSVFSQQALKPQEEVLRWPMIENSFAKRTVNDARIELQTWLSVQHEIRPVRQLWLMGANAASYLLPEATIYKDSHFQAVSLADSSVKALVLPSLNELLQKPAAKQQLFSAIHRYQIVTQ